jgi:hypothetical protein
MRRADLIKELVDYFEFRNRFASDEYWGMAGSQRPKLFVEYYEKLSSSAKMQMADIITEGSIGRMEDLQAYTANTLDLEIDLCLRGFRTYFEGGLKEFEREFNDSDNIETWTAAADAKELPRDLAFKKDWHYALMLKNLLLILNSNNFRSTYDHLLTHARSRQFRKALVFSIKVLEESTAE